MYYNGTTKDFIRVLRGRERPAWASRSLDIDDHNRLRKTEIEPRIINVPILIYHEGFTDLQRKKEELAEWLVHDKPKKLEFEDEPERHYLSLVNGLMDHEEESYWATAEIEFVCPDGFKHGKHKSLILTPTEESHEITGQLPTHWKSRTIFTRSQSMFEIESVSGKIKLTYNFVKGDVLEIDSYSRTIKLNNSIDLDVGLSLNSRWFVLKPNYMTLRANHETTVHYTEKYY